MTLSAIEDYEDIARRLKEIRPETVKPPASGWYVEVPEAKNEIDWGFLNNGMDCA